VLPIVRAVRVSFGASSKVVLTWLRYPKRNYGDYSEIVISDENLAKLPEAGDVSDRVARIFDDSFQEPSEDAEKEGPTQILTEVQDRVADVLKKPHLKDPDPNLANVTFLDWLQFYVWDKFCRFPKAQAPSF
jgi:hypothetical protein